MKKLQGFITIVLAMLITIGFAQSNDWYKLEKKEFGFKIDFPEKPKTKVWKADTSLDFFYETYDFHCFPDKKKSNAYWVEYAEYPDSIANSDNLDKNTLEHFYEQGINSELKRCGECKILSEKTINLKGYTGKEVKIEVLYNSHILTMRLFLIKNNLYRIETSGDPDNPYINRFFDSFDLLYL